MTTWTKIPKASNNTHSTTINVGNPIGLLLSLTYAASSSPTVGIWTDIPKAPATSWNKTTKASATVWTNITKAS